MTPYQITVIES